MGIFSKNKVAPSRERSLKKRADICSTFFNKEVVNIQESIKEDLASNEEEISEFAARKVKAWAVLDRYIIKFMTQWDRDYLTGTPVLPKWEYFADVVHYSKFNLAREIPEKIKVEEIIEQVRYLNHVTKNGGLVTMPGTNLEKSRRYRGYLAANSFSGNLGWDWMNSTANERNFADNQLALLIGDFMTEVFDRYGFNSESGFSGIFAAAILNGWDTSLDRIGLEV
jgi:hypothetical protein